MTSRYQKPYTIPEGFPELLKQFSREILRVQPNNIYEFGARYFAELLEQREPIGGQQQGAQVEQIEHEVEEPTEGLEDVIMKLFVSADLDGSGQLDRREFAQVLSSTDLNLTARQINNILSEADENSDGLISYKEFVPVMLDILEAIHSLEDAVQAEAESAATARAEVEQLLVHGLKQDELEAMMIKIFKKADTDSSGFLSRSEFRNCLSAAELGLTRKDINMLMTSVDEDEDHRISYEEFAPLCWDIIVERFKDDLMVRSIIENASGLEAELIRAFSEADPQSTALLSAHDVKNVLSTLSYELLGLTKLQIITIMSAARIESVDSSSQVINYVKFAPVAAGMIHSFYDNEAQRRRIAAVSELSNTEGAQLLSMLAPEAVMQVLIQAFQAADKDGSGKLTGAEIMECLNGLAGLMDEEGDEAKPMLSEQQMSGLVAALDIDQDGELNYTEVLDFLGEVLGHIERERLLEESAAKEAAGAAPEEA